MEKSNDAINILSWQLNKMYRKAVFVFCLYIYLINTYFNLSSDNNAG